MSHACRERERESEREGERAREKREKKVSAHVTETRHLGRHFAHQRQPNVEFFYRLCLDLAEKMRADVLCNTE